MKFLLIITSILLLHSSFSSSATITEDIARLCQDSPIILLGEQHKQPNSQKLFLNLVRHFDQGGDTVFIGLEISADKQLNLEFTMLGGTMFSYLPSIIDHPAYREMIYSFGSMEKNIVVKAIDARDDEADRDKAMSRNIQTAFSSGIYKKILVLVGNNHVIRDIKWHPESGNENKKYLAGYLIADGVEPCSVQQLFRVDGDGGKGPMLVKTDIERGSAIAMEVVRYVNHSSEMKGDRVSDGVVVW